MAVSFTRDNKNIDIVRYFSIALVSVVWGLITLKEGIIFAPDSRGWSNYGDLLIKHNFNYFNFLSDTNFITPIVLYSAWVTVVAITKLIFGNYWGTAIVVVSYISAVYTMLLILKATRMFSEKSACVIFACIALILCFDFHMWIRYVLSDILYASICFAILFLSLNLFRDPSRPQKRFVISLILIGIAVVFRPVFPPLLAFIFLSLLVGLILKSEGYDTNKRQRLIINLTIFACIAIPTALVLHSYVMLDPSNWPFPFFKAWILQISNEYHLGITVYKRPETYQPPPIGVLDYLFITISKFFYFFVIDLDGYSKMHAFLSYIFFLPIYAFSAFSLFQLYKKESGLTPIKWWIIFSCFIFIFLFAFFHSCNEIDYDLRYRVPCLPPLILLATIGFNEFIELTSSKVKKSPG